MDTMGGQNDTLVNEVHVMPRLFQPLLEYIPVVTTTTAKTMMECEKNAYVVCCHTNRGHNCVQNYKKKSGNKQSTGTHSHY